MGRAVSIIVSGHAGAVGGELVRRGDLDTYWALGAEEASAIASRVRPALVLSCSAHARPLLDEEVGAPLLFIAEDEPALQGCASLPRSDACLSTDAGTILSFCEARAGVRFARFPRVRAEFPVQVARGTHRTVVQSMELSASGMSIVGSEFFPVDAELELTFGPPLLDLWVRARVVRAFGSVESPRHGVRFVELGSAALRRLETFVRQQQGLGLETLSPPAPPSTRGSDPVQAALRGQRPLLLEPPLELRLVSPETVLMRGSELRDELAAEAARTGQTEPRTRAAARAFLAQLGQGVYDPEAHVEHAQLRAQLLRELDVDAPFRAGTRRVAGPPSST